MARQTESEFKKFDRTESGQKLGSLYEINRLKKSEDIAGDVVISTIQKLFSVLTGQSIEEDDEDKEDELLIFKDNEKDTKPIELGDDLKLPPDYFQFIIVDECHRSIYGKWKKVLDYFNSGIKGEIICMVYSDEKSDNSNMEFQKTYYKNHFLFFLFYLIR